MIAPSREAEEHGLSTMHTGPMRRARRAVAPTMAVRSKDVLVPAMPLPRWMSWVLVGWLVATATAYTAILAGWWR